jgi:hypothetical protein
MRRHATILTIVLTAVTLMAGTAWAQRGPRNGGARTGGGGVGTCGQTVADYLDSLEVVPLSAAEEAAIADLREEEKLARDVYLTLAERWQLPIFANIAQSEQTHMDAVARVIALYGMADPVADDTVGAFTSTEYAALYESLVATGETSLADALAVGATIEDLDLADLYEMLDLSANPQVGFLAQNLAKGSRNHLRAFVGALAAQGGSYSAQYLDQATIDAIVAAPAERGVVYDADGEVLAECGGGRRGGRRGPGGGGHGAGGGNGPGNGVCDGQGPRGN